MSNIESKCEKCGGSYELVERRGGLEIFQCMDCGSTKVFHVSPSLDVFSELLTDSTEVVVVWERSPNVKDLAKLRQEVESLQGFTVTELKAKVVGNTFSLGNHSSKKAKDYRHHLEAHGLSVKLVKQSDS